MTQTRLDVKSVIQDARRKEKRNKEHDDWTNEELNVIQKNCNLQPMQIERILLDNIEGFSKNLDHIRKMKRKFMDSLKKAAPS